MLQPENQSKRYERVALLLAHWSTERESALVGW
jgi:hypothetical protein